MITQSTLESEIGVNLNDLLVCNDISQRQLAKDLNVSNATISRICAGRMPTGEMLIKLADYFQVSIDWLVGRET